MAARAEVVHGASFVEHFGAAAFVFEFAAGAGDAAGGDDDQCGEHGEGGEDRGGGHSPAPS
jgi:hypothetical protein